MKQIKNYWGLPNLQTLQELSSYNQTGVIGLSLMFIQLKIKLNKAGVAKQIEPPLSSLNNVNAIGNCTPSGGSAKELHPKGNIVIPRAFRPEG